MKELAGDVGLKAEEVGKIKPLKPQVAALDAQGLKVKKNLLKTLDKSGGMGIFSEDQIQELRDEVHAAELALA